MSARRDALRSYLLEVTRDLIKNGILRHGQGQTLGQILEAELPTVLKSAADDFKTIGGEMMDGLVSSALGALFGKR